MVKTVEEGFRTFHGRLTPTGGESDAAMRHRASIEACLKANFAITHFFRTGSFGNGTSIRGYSDVDYFAVIPKDNLKANSSYTLRDVRNALDARFPNTGVAVRTPAVLVPFGTDASESTEVVPADYIETDNRGFRIYEIADGQGEWMRSSPDAHNVWVTTENNRLSNKVKPLIRFLKAWEYFKNVPISSFYLELRVTQYASEQDTIVYSYDVREILKQLWDNQLAAFQDPMGISGFINPCSSDAKKAEALSKLNTALTRAENARSAEESGNIADAFGWCNLLYDEQFPVY